MSPLLRKASPAQCELHMGIPATGNPIRREGRMRRTVGGRLFIYRRGTCNQERERAGRPSDTVPFVLPFRSSMEALTSASVVYVPIVRVICIFHPSFFLPSCHPARNGLGLDALRRTINLSLCLLDLSNMVTCSRPSSGEKPSHTVSHSLSSPHAIPVGFSAASLTGTMALSSLARPSFFPTHHRIPAGTCSGLAMSTFGKL